MASASSSTDVPASVLDASQTAQLSDNPRLHDVGDTRDLIARRNRALDSLPLDEESKDALEAELRVVGWPDSLRKDGLRAQKVDGKFKDSDIYALLCIKRHINATPTQLEPFFDNSDRKKWGEKWNKMVLEAKKRWREEDDKKLMRLYEDDETSFADIAEQDFQACDEKQVQTNYALAKKRSRRRR